MAPTLTRCDIKSASQVDEQRKKQPVAAINPTEQNDAVEQPNEEAQMPLVTDHEINVCPVIPEMNDIDHPFRSLSLLDISRQAADYELVITMDPSDTLMAKLSVSCSEKIQRVKLLHLSLCI